jgi:hypothetical protein
MPWKWIAVLSFPSPLYALILIVSPTLRSRAGHGHCPLMPTKGRSNPLGAAFTQPIFQLKVLNFGLGILVNAETARTCKTKIRSVFANIFRTVVTVARNPLKLKRMLSSPLHVHRPLRSRKYSKNELKEGGGVVGGLVARQLSYMKIRAPPFRRHKNEKQSDTDFL